MPHFAASELSLHCLHVSQKPVSGLQRVNDNEINDDSGTNDDTTMLAEQNVS